MIRTKRKETDNRNSPQSDHTIEFSDRLLKDYNECC